MGATQSCWPGLFLQREFAVTMLDNDTNAERERGTLRVTPVSLALDLPDQLVRVWPLSSLRRYGYDRQVFLFAARRADPRLAGTWTFSCPQAGQIFRLIERHVKDLNITARDPAAEERFLDPAKMIKDRANEQYCEPTKAAVTNSPRREPKYLRPKKEGKMVQLEESEYLCPQEMQRSPLAEEPQTEPLQTPQHQHQSQPATPLHAQSHVQHQLVQCSPLSRCPTGSSQPSPYESEKVYLTPQEILACTSPSQVTLL